MTAAPEDRARALLRGISDCTKRLEKIYANDKAIKTVFSYEAYGHRLRLKEMLQKLMFLNSVSYGKRAEELLWRKVYYEPLHLYKLYIKNNDRPDRVADFELSLRMHILSGIGYYQSLLLQIQSETSLTLGPALYSWLTTPFHVTLYNEDIYQFDQRRSLPHVASSSKIAQRCLMYIGDLFRYLVELGEPCAKALAYAYYSAAYNVEPTVGLPQNQLGILDIGRCYGLNALYHYLLCLGARVPFEGAKRNLMIVLTKNEVRYRKLFGEKPIYGLYLRHPKRYRPKDFRKTITKFIFIIQQFLKPSRSEWDCDLTRVFNDALFEFHLMLSINPELTLEPIHSPDELARSDVEDGRTERENRGEDHSLYSEQLTGPIFVRILMIALLTANLFGSERVVRKTIHPVGDETTSSTDGGKQTRNSSEVETSIENQGESALVDQQADRSDPTSNEVPPSNLAVDNQPMDPHGPLSFLLQLCQIYMDHVSRQLTELLHMDHSSVHLSPGRYVQDRNMATEDVEVDSTADQAGEHGMRSHTTDPAALAHEQPEMISEADGEEDGGESDNDIPDRCYTHRSIRDKDTEDEDRRIRLAMTASSSDEDSDRMFGVRGMNGESDDDDDDEEEEEEELSPEFWSSDDSSLLHSQDEAASPEHSSNEEDISECLSDRRLRRMPHFSSSAFGANRRRTPHTSSSQLKSGGTGATDELSTDMDRCPGNDASTTLDPITEEESAAEERRSVRRGERGRRRYSMKTSSESENDSIQSSKDLKPKGGVRYSLRNARKGHNSHGQDVPDEPPDSASVAPSLIHEPDVCLRARAVSRLYLLPAVKLVADWICCAATHHPELLSSLLPGYIPNAVKHGSDECIPDQSSCNSLIGQDWCAQLAHLLNELHPLIVQVAAESKGGANNSPDFKESNLRGPISDLLSPLGQYALLNELCSLSQTKLFERSKDVADNSTETGIKSPPNENVASAADVLRFALPEDWLLRGLDSLTSLHCKMNFNKSTVLQTFNIIDEAILRSVHLTSIGHQLAKLSHQLGIQFTVDHTLPKPFQSPQPSSRAHTSHPVHHPAGWFFPNRRGRGRYPHRSKYPSNHYYQYQQKYGRCDFPAGSNRCSGKRGHWFIPYTRGSQGHAHRGHTVAFMNRTGKAARPIEPHMDPRHVAHSRRPQCGYKPGTQGEIDPGSSPTRTGSGDVAKQSSNSSLPLTEAEVQPASEENLNPEDLDSRKTQLMRDMARLRLLNEVDQLARQCQNTSPRTQPSAVGGATGITAADADTSVADNFVSPYVVLDAYCLTSHLPAVKQLVHSEAFVLIIPVAVVAHLDYLKKTMATSRFAIRYLEQETHSGNRYLRLQRPEEQPKDPFQLSRLVYPRNTTNSGTNSGSADGEAIEEELPNETGPIANPRVVRRWLSILDCAVYFSQIQTSEGDAQDGPNRTVPSDCKLTMDRNMQNTQPFGSDDCSADVPGSVQPALAPREEMPTTLINSPATCCNLLSILHDASREATQDQDLRTSLVTVLIGTRDAAPEDSIVPREFLNLVHKSGVRFELLRNFIQRWKKSRPSSHPTGYHETNLS